MKKNPLVKPTYKAIMLDLDGTTIKNDHNSLPSPRVIKAVKKAQKLGIHVCLVTGRPYVMVTKVAQKLTLNGLFAVLNGAQIIHVASGEILIEKSMSKKATNSIIKILRERQIPFLVNDNGVNQNTPTAYKPNKPFGVCSFGREEKVVKELEVLFSKIEGIYFHRIPGWQELGYQTCIGITHKDATKQHAVIELARILKIDTHEIIGVGDGYNDFPMMMACGLRVAMGNAVPELKEIADYIAPTVDEDGVADVIEKYILNS